MTLTARAEEVGRRPFTRRHQMTLQQIGLVLWPVFMAAIFILGVRWASRPHRAP
jgi:hypothetical protein